MSEQVVRHAPPDAVIYAACAAAVRSPCRKSQRGAVVFHPFTGFQAPPGFNSRPDMRCDDRCFGALASTPSVCAMMCLHAEQRAIRFMLDASVRSQFVADGDMTIDVMDCELVHAKVVDGQLVPSGPPSCWQCAKEIVDVGLVGVWLYEELIAPPATWQFYPAREFYARTLQECGLGR